MPRRHWALPELPRRVVGILLAAAALFIGAWLGAICDPSVPGRTMLINLLASVSGGVSVFLVTHRRDLTVSGVWVGLLLGCFWWDVPMLSRHYGLYPNL